LAAPVLVHTSEAFPPYEQDHVAKLPPLHQQVAPDMTLEPD
jgi:hypothetical protein